MNFRGLVIIFIIFSNFSVYSQNAKVDSVHLENKKIINTDSLHTDTLNFDKDSVILDSLKSEKALIHENLEDTATEQSFGSDSIADNEVLKKIVTDTISTDSIRLDTLQNKNSDTIKHKPVKTYSEVMNYVSDSLFFEEPDTIHYVIHNLGYLLENDSVVVSDTTKQAIYKLMEYSKNVDIEKVINYLQQKMTLDSTIEYQDSTIKTFRDSVFHAVKYLLESIPEDSVKFSFKNMDRDSVLFSAAENEEDSVRLNLYDNRGEEAVLWIKKSADDVFDIYLEDGIYLEKAHQRKVVNPKLDADFDFPELKKVEKTNLIIPIWDFEGVADIKFNQGHISESWAEGGESSISTLSVLKYSADYSYGKLRNLDTDVEYRLGYLKAGDNPLQKNDDKFELNAKYGKQAFNDWYYSSLLNFKTQFFKGKEYVNDSTVNSVSAFLSPAYLVFSLGLDYKPSSKLTVLISPLTSKFTIVADTVNYDQTRYGVGQNEKIRKEIGAYVKAISKLKFRDNIVLENKVNFFTNYTKNPQNIDVDWELNLGVQLNDYIKMSVNTHLIYDDDVTYTNENGKESGPSVQFKELFGIGFTYSF